MIKLTKPEKKPIIKTYIGELTTEKILKMIFTEKDNNNNLLYPIQINTTEANQTFVPHETKESMIKKKEKPRNYSLYFNYSNKLDFLAEKKITSIRKIKNLTKALKSLEEEGFIIDLQNLFSEKEKEIANEYDKILRANHPSFEIETTFLTSDIKFIKDKSAPDISVKGKIYILNNPEEYNISPIQIVEEEIKAIYERFLPKKAKKDLKDLKTMKFERMRRKFIDDLETFENQRLVTKTFSFMDVYSKDLIDYLGEIFLRECPKCKTKVIIPKNIDPDKYNPSQKIDIIDKSSEKQYEKLKNWQKLYTMSFEEALEDDAHHLHNKAISLKQMTKEQLKNENRLIKKPTKYDFAEALNLIRKNFRCKECKASIIKQRLLHIKNVVYTWGIGLEARKSVILYGYPEIVENSSLLGKRWEEPLLQASS